MADLYKDFEEAGLAVRSKGQGKGYAPGDTYRQMTGRDYAPGDYAEFAPGNATPLSTTSPTPRRTAIGQPAQQEDSPEYLAYLESLRAPRPAPEPAPEERGFFGKLGNLAIEGGKSTLRSAQVAPAVISGTEVMEKAGLIAEELNKPRTDRPAELQEIDTAFKPVGEQWQQAEGFGQSALAIGNMLLTVGKQAVTNPKGLAYMTSEQLANMAPSLAGVLVGAKAGAVTGTAVLPGYGTAVGAAVGGVAGGFAGGAPVEIGSEFINIVGKAINEMGVQPTEENVRALLADEKFLNTALSQARIKGATTAGIDAAMTMVAGGAATAPRRAALKTATAELGAGSTAAQIAKRADDILATRSVASKVGTGAAAVGVETAGGGLSEAGGQLAAYGEVDLADVGKEMLGEMGGSALSVPAGAKAVMEGSRPRPSQDPRTVTEKSGNVEITYPVGEQPQGELSREQILEQRVNELESVVSQYLAPQSQEPLATPAAEPVETVAPQPTRAERQLAVQRQIDAENNPRVDQPVTSRIAPDGEFSAPPALAPIREPRGALDPERTRRTIDAAAAEPSAFDRQMVMEQGGLSRPQEDTGARFVDTRPMAPREAQLRLTVLRDQFAQRGGDATGLTIVQHPTAPNKFAIELRSNVLPDLNLNTPIDSAVAQNRIESAALAGQVDARRQEDSARQAVINRAMRNIEERGGVASPAEARLLQEANLGQPYDRVDPSLAPAQSVDERLTAATGIELVGQPRESVRTTPQREAMNEVGAAELQARREANQAGAEARTQAAIEQTSRAPAAPDAAAVVEALKVAPVLRTAEQTAAIKQARARMAPNDFGILQKHAQAPVQMTNADRQRLNELLNPTPETTETAEAQESGRLAQEPKGKILTSDAKLSTKRAPVPGSTIKLNDEGTDHDIKIVPASKLGAKGKLLQQIARIFGKRLVTFESDTLQADGFVLSGNNENIYVNANSEINPLAVFGHELLHQLKRDNPQAYLALEAVIRRNMKESPEMDAEYGGYDADSRVEEVTADLVGNRFTDPDFWNDVFSEIRDMYPDQAQGIISRLTDALVKAIAAFRNAIAQNNYRADEFVNNLDEITKAIKDTFVEYTQAQKPVAQEVDARAEDAATAAPEEPQGTPTFADTREPAVTTETPQTPVIPDAVNDPSAKDETIQFSLRRKPDPKNTVKAYKLFRVDAKKPGQLFPLFVNANDPVQIGQWLDADIGEQTAGGKVKSKLGPLAFRPGWHAGDLPIATHIGGKSDNTLTAPDTRPDNQVWAEVEMAADRDWQTEANARARRNKDGEIILNTAHITDRIPEDGFYRYKTNANMTGNWLIGGSMKVNRVLSDAEVEQINSAAGTADLPRAKPFDAAKYGFDSTPATPAEPANTEAAPAADTNAGAPQEQAQDGITASRSRQVDTPEFKRWFGDSKVVDENGEPLVVYHGTDSRFKVFKMREAELGLGAYFTDDREWASEFGSNVVPAYLSIKKPLLLTGPYGVEVDQYGNDFDPANIPTGHDGIIHKQSEDSPAEYVVFDPTQIKSATGNNGQFDPANPDITQSRRRPQVGKNIFGDIVESGWEVSDVNNKDTVVRALQDKMVDTKRVIQAITEKVGAISDKFDAYLQEELFYGRSATRIKDFNSQEVKPLMEEMSRLGIQPKELEEYLHNRHAEVRNERMKERGYKGDDASGISTADARAYLANLDPIKRKQLDALASRVDDISKKTRDLMVEYGLETRDTMNQWEKDFPYYVPLFRKEGDFSPRSSNMGTGSGLSVSGGSSKKAKGSQAEVADILANIFQQRERAVIRGEKNRVGAALFGLAVTNPNPDFWLAVKPDAFANDPNLDAKLTEFGIDPADARNLMQQPQNMRDYAVGVRINGQDHFVFFNNNNERANEMVRALKNMDADQLGAVLGTIGKVTRYMANVNTQYNPIFGIVNLARDVHGAALNLTTTGIADKKSQVLSDTLPAIKGIYGALRAERAGKPEPTNEWAQLWRKFIDLGGQTGYRDQYSSAQQRAEAFAREMKRVSDGKPVKSLRSIFEWLSDYNETLENGVRLAAFKAALDKGMTEQRAASIAKNLTVNFNRKGTVAVQAGALYAFFNAAVQGSARIYQTLTGPAGLKIVAGGIVLGGIQALALSMAGFEEDEPPDFIKERNLIIPLGFFSDDMKTKYVTIPMPLGYNVIPNFSRVLTEWAMNDFKDPAKRVLQISGSFLEAFNPIGNAGWSVQTLTPSFMDPIAALSENRDFTGKPIYKENMSDLDPTPGYLRARDTANVFTKAISKFLNEISGGTEFKPGAIDWTPDAIEYLIGQATGGVGRELNKIGNMIVNAESGEKTEPYKVPLAGRFYGDTDTPGTVSARFYQNVTELNKHWNEIQGLAKSGQNVNKYIQENPEAALSQSVSTYMKTIGDLKKEVTRLKESGASKDAVKYYENRITELMTDLNNRVKQFK